MTAPKSKTVNATNAIARNSQPLLLNDFPSLSYCELTQHLAPPSARVASIDRHWVIAAIEGAACPVRPASEVSVVVLPGGRSR